MLPMLKKNYYVLFLLIYMLPSTLLPLIIHPLKNLGCSVGSFPLSSPCQLQTFRQFNTFCPVIPTNWPLDPKAEWFMFGFFVPQFPNLTNGNPYLKVWQLTRRIVVTSAEVAKGWKTTLVRASSETSHPANPVSCLLQVICTIADKSQTQFPHLLDRLMRLLMVKWGNAFKQDF